MVKESKPARRRLVISQDNEDEESEEPVVDSAHPTKNAQSSQGHHQDAEQRPAKRLKASEAQHQQQSSRGESADQPAEDAADEQGLDSDARAAAGQVQGKATSKSTRATRQGQHESGKGSTTADSLQPAASGSLSVRKRLPKTEELRAAEARKVWPEVDEDEWGGGLEQGKDEPPAISVVQTPPVGDEAAGWGLWQFYAMGDGAWYRGVVFGYDHSKRQYIFCMEDGEGITNVTEAQWLREFKNKELILCRPPGHAQLAAEQATGQVYVVENEQQPGGEEDGKQQARKRKRPQTTAGKQQENEPAQETPAAAAVDVQAQATAEAGDAQDDADMTAAATLAMVMPGAVHDHAVQPHHKDHAQQQQPSKGTEPPVSGTKQKQQQQRRQQSQRQVPGSSGKAQQKQQGTPISPHGSRPASGIATAAAASAAATAALQRPMSGGKRVPTQQQLDLSGLPDREKRLAERLQQLQEAEQELQRYQQQAVEALEGIGKLLDEDEAGFADMAKDMRQHLDAQQQQETSQQQQQQAKKTQGPGTRLCLNLKTLLQPDNKLIVQQRKIHADAEKYFNAMKPGGGATAARQKSGGAGPQQRKSESGPAEKQQQGQQGRLSSATAAGSSKHDAAVQDKQKHEKMATAAAAKVDELQAALQQQRAALEAAEKEAADRSKELQLFKKLVPVQLLDNSLRDKAVAMLAALLQPPVSMSPFAMAHQIEAQLHDQHGLVGTGKHMYLQHLHFIWNVLGGKQLEAAAEAADQAHQKAYLAAGIDLFQEADGASEHRPKARQVAAATKAAAEAAVGAAKAAMVVQPGIADPSAIRAALLEGKLSVVDLVHETAATLGFDQQRDK